MVFDPSSLPDLNGRVYLVTGGNAGIGYQTVKALAAKKATVYLCARSESKAQTAIATIRESIQKPTAPIHYLYLDHMDLSTIISGAQTFLSKESSLHGLILNAGIMCTPYEKSTDGHEAHLQTNYISHFLLASLLLPVLKATALNSEPGQVRIVEVTSGAWAMAKGPGINFDKPDLPDGKPFDRYAQSKLANVLHIKELHKHVGPKGVKPEKGEIWTASVHPGLVETNLSANYASTSLLGRTMIRLGLAATPEKGALTTIFTAASNDFKREWSGGYMVPTAKKGWLYMKANDLDLQDKLWKWTEGELKGKGFLA
ncbi:hypothetical protein ABW20_dc0104280 [Dactylellina cionopaga]|nr:hypothetical protein ABW20_dc0104280 [Dactylellina cionopaga]